MAAIQQAADESTHKTPWLQTYAEPRGAASRCSRLLLEEASKQLLLPQTIGPRL